MEKKTVRTRFAPSPTGYMHVGNLRTALYAFLVARKNEGDFILRIEDTDQERLVGGAVDIIYTTLRETGLFWDEGPDVGGPVGPYIQSERRDIYKKYAMELVEKGEAYRCFCDKERLEEVRKLQTASNALIKYDGHCRHLSPEEIEEKLDANVPYIIRQKCPTTGTTTFHDLVYGDITVENESLDDQVLMKADGLPTYNFANVVDDHLMGITHVIRGSEYLSSTPKYNLLYQSFGWEIPNYIHCPPVMKNATEKLSKRNGDASFQDLVAKGYLTPAIINYIALLGWSPKSEQEIFSLADLTEIFDPENISKSPAIFDIPKLNYINGEYIRAMELGEFHSLALPWIRKTVNRTDVSTMLIAKVLQPRCEVLEQIPEQVDFVDELPDYDINMYVHKKMKTTLENSKTALEAILPILENLSEEDFLPGILHDRMMELVGELELKNGQILWPLRVAVSGKQFTPGGGTDLCAILGKEDSIQRVKIGIEKLS